jgi:hypothetical protein
MGVFGAIIGLASISTGAGPTFAEGYSGLPSTSAGPVGLYAAGIGAGLSYLVARNAFAESSLVSWVSSSGACFGVVVFPR